MRYASIALRVTGIDFDSSLEQCNTLIEAFLRGLASEITALGVCLECLLIHAAVPPERSTLGSLNRSLNLRSNRFRHLALKLQRVAEIALILLGPQVPVVRRAD